jgi:DNA-binding NarL/FixJ family response regulator
MLVGREQELALLQDARRALARSRPAVVLIEGEAGIGKSRLLGQFVDNAGEGRARTLVGVECLEHAAAPFGPIRDALAQLERASRIALPRALAAFVARDPTVEALEKADLFATVADYLRACARQRSTILTIEDLHWADATTLEFIGYAAAHVGGTRLLIVATYRSDETERRDALTSAVARAMREPHTFRLELRALKGALIRDLLHGVQGGHPPLGAPTIDDIVARAEGNPFFAEELLKNALERSDERGRTDLPLSIRTSIVERLRAFAPEERRVVDQAAVLGLRFDPDVLARTMQTGVDAILPALRRARDANLMVEEDAERVRFRFRHALTRQAVYDELLLFDARRTHRSILETLESFGTDDELLEELAYHAWEARDAAKTLNYNERAGEVAFALFALPEARICFERALEAASSRADEARLLARLGRVTSMLGNVSTAIDIYIAASEAAVEVGAFDDAAQVTEWSAADRNNSGDTTAVAFGTAFLERFGDRLSQRRRDSLLALLARLATIAYDVDTAATLSARIEAPEALPPNERQNAVIARQDIAWICSDANAWSAAAEELLELLPAMPAFAALAASLTLAQAASYFGRDDLVARAFRHADRIEARNEFGVLRAYGAAIRTIDLFARGDLEGARSVIRGALDSPDLHVSTSAFATVSPFVAVALDDDGLVTPDVETEFAAVRGNPRNADDALTLAASAAWGLRHGRTREALADLRRALGCLTTACPNSHEVLSLAALHLPLGELPALERFADPERRPEGDRIGRALAHTVGAIVASRTDDAERARELGESAAAAYRILGRPLLEARALEAAGALEQAGAIYARCGATGHLRRLRTAETAAPRAARAQDPLSEREREVAHCIAAGLANAAIAERLSITAKTVEKHVSSIYDKLGVRSRAQVAVLLARDADDDGDSPTLSA